MIAGAPHEVVQPCSFTSEHDYRIGPEIVAVVIGGAALVETDDPEVALLEGFKGADEVDDAGQAEVLGRAGRSFDGHGAERGRAALGEEDSIHAGTLGGTKKGAEVLRIFDAVEGKEQARFFAFEQVFEVEEGALLHDGHHPLVRCGSGEPGEGIARLSAEGDSGCAGQGGDFREAMGVPLVEPLARDADVVEAADAGTESLLDGMQAKKHFHSLQSIVAEEVNRTDNGRVTGSSEWRRGFPVVTAAEGQRWI